MALDLLVERNYAATYLEDAAMGAGVSKGTLYLYFTDKDGLFKAVVRENVVPVLGEAEEIIDRYEGESASLFRDIILGWRERIQAVCRHEADDGGVEKFSRSGAVLLRTRKRYS